MGEKETASQFAASDDSLNDPDDLDELTREKNENLHGKPSKEQRTSGDGSGAAAVPTPSDSDTAQVIKTKTKSNQSND